MKKRICLLLVSIVALNAIFFASCSQNTIEIPSYSGAESFRFLAHTPPPPGGYYMGNPDYITDEHYQNMADCGFNYIIGVYENTVSDYVRAMVMAEKYGMKYLVRDRGVNSMERIINADYPNATAQTPSEYLDLCKEELKARIDEYSKYPAYAGVFAFDEPSRNSFEAIKVVQDWYKENYDTEFLVNLLPSYANNSLLFGSATTAYGYREDYVNYFADFTNPQILSYDNYPLLVDENDYKRMSGNYLKDLETFADKSKSSGIPFHVYVATQSQYSYRLTEHYRDMAFLVYTSMAYGTTGVQAWSYWTDLSAANNINKRTAVVADDGTKLAAWYAMQDVIREVREFEQVYMNFKWQGTLCYNADDDYPNKQYDLLINSLESHSRISSVTTSQDCIIGTFKDSQGRDGFIVSNLTDPYLNLKANVVLKFNNASHAVVYKKGRQTIQKLNKGNLTLDIGSGEGWFVIPI